MLQGIFADRFHLLYRLHVYNEALAFYRQILISEVSLETSSPAAYELGVVQRIVSTWPEQAIWAERMLMDRHKTSTLTDQEIALKFLNSVEDEVRLDISLLSDSDTALY